MTQTRGRKKIRILTSAPATSNFLGIEGAGRIVDSYFSQLEIKISESFAEDLVSLIARQYAVAFIGSYYLEKESALSKALSKVERDAKRLFESYDALLQTKDGIDALDDWGLGFNSVGKHPIAVFADMLAGLKDFEEQNVYIVNPKDLYYKFIQRIEKTFIEHNQSTALHSNSVFQVFIEFVDDCVPGLSFPTDTQPSGRYDFLRRALGKRNPK